MDAILFGWIARIAAVLALAAIGTAILRRPRIRATATLRGPTSTGVLYVVVTNRGSWIARGVKVHVWWKAADGARAVAKVEEIGNLSGRDARSLPIKGFAIEGPRGLRWAALGVRVTARNAFPTSTSIPLQTRSTTDATAPPSVEYRRVERCPIATDGVHLNDVKPLYHDGVTERWEVCRLCGHLTRVPLTADEEATQARVRRDRIERERRRMEDEFRRREEDDRERARTTGSRARRDARDRSAPPTETDPFPVADAYRILGLGPTATWDDVAATHRQLAKRFHPDRAPAADASTRAELEERMQDINRARDRLREHFVGSGFK